MQLRVNKGHYAKELVTSCIANSNSNLSQYTCLAPVVHMLNPTSLAKIMQWHNYIQIYITTMLQC